VGRLSFHCGGSDHLAWLCESYRRSAGANHWPQSRVTPITTADYPLAAQRPANCELDCRLSAKVFGFSGEHWTRAFT
jgi:dTDP-4-dehydrorhamnose reductase